MDWEIYFLDPKEPLRSIDQTDLDENIDFVITSVFITSGTWLDIKQLWEAGSWDNEMHIWLQWCWYKITRDDSRFKIVKWPKDMPKNMPKDMPLVCL